MFIKQKTNKDYNKSDYYNKKEINEMCMVWLLLWTEMMNEYPTLIIDIVAVLRMVKPFDLIMVMMNHRELEHPIV